MGKFLTALLIARNIVTFGNSLFVFLSRCSCGSNDVKAAKYGDGWIVYCADCRIRTPEYRWKRTAKRAWNETCEGMQ